MAASRRKDRSLDARLESAHRASMLHKKRTGKALYITREIVEKEAMYEEVDERYQEKRLRMLQAQNMQIEEQFQRQLLAAFAAGANSARSRHSISASNAPADGVKKMRIEIPSARASFSEGASAAPTTSPMLASSNHVGTPTTTYAQTPGTPYVQTPDSYVQTPGGYSNSFPSPQIPQYVTQQNAWRQQPFNLLPRRQQQGYQAPQQTEVQTVDSWRRRVLQQSLASSEASTPTQAFRSRLASAPEPRLLAEHPVVVAPRARAPSGTAPSPRARSEPSIAEEEEKSTTSEPLSTVPPQTFVAQNWGTPDLCPSPGSFNSASNTSWDDNVPPEMVTHDSAPMAPLMVSSDELDPDFADFNQFALGLGTSSHYQDGLGLEASAFDDWVALDLDFAAAA